MKRLFKEIGVLIIIASPFAAVWFMYYAIKHKELNYIYLSLFFGMLFFIADLFITNKKPKIDKSEESSINKDKKEIKEKITSI